MSSQLEALRVLTPKARLSLGPLREITSGTGGWTAASRFFQAINTRPTPPAAAPICFKAGNGT